MVEENAENFYITLIACCVFAEVLLCILWQWPIRNRTQRSILKKKHLG